MTKKQCTKCKEWKEFSEFHKNKISKDGFNYKCKECVKKYREENIDRIKKRKKEYNQENKDKIQAYKKKYREENKDSIDKYNKKYREENPTYFKEYREKNKDKINARGKEYQQENKKRFKEYRQDNKESIKKYKKGYYQDNKEQINLKGKEYKLKNIDRIKERGKEYQQENKEHYQEYQQKYKNSPMKFNSETKHRQEIELYEEVRESTNGNVECKCTYCNEWFEPNKIAISYRLIAINNIDKGEGRLYCSEGCKNSCPIYGQQIYSRDKKEASSREVRGELRKLVLARDKYTCQKCKKHKDELEEGIGLHCHHKEGILWEPLQSADMDMCITFCAECHKEVHKIDGCGYHDMQCTG